MTYARTDTRILELETQSRPDSHPHIKKRRQVDEEEYSDSGDSDGAGGAMPYAIPGRPTSRPITLPAAKWKAGNIGEEVSASQLIKGYEYQRNIAGGK